MTDAAGWAIQAGNLENAVELLEQGRSILWSQSLQLRTDLTRLRLVNEDLASRLDGVRTALDQPRAIYGTLEGDYAKADWNQEFVASRQRELARQWDDLIKQVRNLPGLESFLAATPFSRLREASSGGPVVVVNISNRRCDALVITAVGVRLCILPGLTADECTRRANTLLETLYTPAVWDEAAQLNRIRVLFSTLSWLWDTICSPVLEDLQNHHDPQGDLTTRDGVMPRLWWCPTGPLTVLPLHAAGRYADPDAGRRTGLPFRLPDGRRRRAAARMRQFTSPPPCSSPVTATSSRPLGQSAMTMHQVAKDTYTELAATGGLDASRAAIAIHRAVEALRAREPSRPDLWAPYLHIGP